jgi:hypothetical protein
MPSAIAKREPHGDVAERGQTAQSAVPLDQAYTHRTPCRRNGSGHTRNPTPDYDYVVFAGYGDLPYGFLYVALSAHHELPHFKPNH